MNTTTANLTTCGIISANNTIGWSPNPDHDDKMELMHKFNAPMELTGFTVNLKYVVAFQFAFSSDGNIWSTYDEV